MANDNPTSQPLPRPDSAQRYFGERIVAGEYKRCLVIMVEEDGSHQIWNATNIWSDAAGLTSFAQMHLQQTFEQSEQEKLGPDADDGEDKPKE